MAAEDNTSPREARGEAERLKVFISYSRNDSRFAAELTAGLEYDGGFEPLIDQHSIHEGEEWKARIGALLAEADSVVLVLTPNWLASGICQWEAEEADRLSKRVVPVLALPLRERQPPAWISAINYVRFDQESDGAPRLFMDGMAALRRALTADFQWIREHTRLLTRAAEWNAAGRVENRMLFGKDIVAAKQWLERQPKSAPPPTELQRDYIFASELSEDARIKAERQRAEALKRSVNRTRFALVLAVTLGIAAAGAGLVALDKGKAAQQARRQAAADRDEALLVQSRHLADISRVQRESGDATTAMLIALSGLPDDRISGTSETRGTTRPYLPALEGRLYEGFFADREMAVIDVGVGPLLSLAQSVDGTRIATGSASGTAVVLEADTGRKIAVINGPQGPIAGLAFTPDGSGIITASGDGALAIWSIATRAQVGEIGPPDVLLTGLATSGDGTRVVAAGEDQRLRVWETNGGKSFVTLERLTGAIGSIAVSDDGTTFASIIRDPEDSRVAIANATSGKWVASVPGLASCVALDGSGAAMLTGTVDGQVRIQETSTGRQVLQLGDAGQPMTAGVFIGRELVAGGFENGSVRVWNLSTKAEAMRLVGHTAAVNAIAVSSSRTRLVSASGDGTVRIWTLADSHDGPILTGHRKAVSSVAIDAEGTRVVTGSWDGTARIWDTGTGRPLADLGGHQSEVSSVAISRDGSRIATGSWDGFGRVFDGATGRILAESRPEGGRVFSVALCADGSRVALGLEDKSARVLDAATGREIARFEDHPGRVTSVAFSPRGDTLLTGAGTTGRVWTVGSSNAPSVLRQHTGSVLVVAVSPDGSRFATGGRDPDVQIWDAATHARIATLSGNDATVTGIAFQDDGRRVVTAAGDGSVRIWITDTGELLARLALHGDGITGVAVSTRGRLLATGSSDTTARMIAMFPDSASLIAGARERAARCLTPAQMKEFHLGSLPPRWCITGPGRERDDGTRWLPKWPYQSPDWRQWLLDKDRGNEVTPPGI